MLQLLKNRHCAALTRVGVLFTYFASHPAINISLKIKVMATNDITQTGRRYLRNGNIEAAIELLRNCPIDDHQVDSDRTMMLSKFSAIKRERSLGVIDSKEHSKQASQVVEGVLFVLNAIDNMETFDPAYKTGSRKLRFELFEEAKVLLGSVSPMDGNYLRARHNYCIAAFATAITRDEVEAVLSDLDALEAAILNKELVDGDLLISFLYDRSEVYKALGHPEIAQYDLEKLRILGSDLGTEPA